MSISDFPDSQHSPYDSQEEIEKGIPRGGRAKSQHKAERDKRISAFRAVPSPDESEHLHSFSGKHLDDEGSSEVVKTNAISHFLISEEDRMIDFIDLEGNPKTYRIQDLIHGEGLPVSEDGLTLLHVAASAGRDDVTALLLRNPAMRDHLDTPDRTGWNSPLHRAIRAENPDIVKQFLDAGAALNIPDNEGCYPLHAAVKTGNSAIVELLIEDNANLVECDLNGCFPWHYAIANKDKKMMSLLIKNLDKDDLCLPDFEGKTALHLAVEAESLPIVQMLVRKKIPLNLEDKFSITPLELALGNASSEIVHFLLKKIASSKNDTPLHLIRKYTSGDIEKHKLLFKELSQYSDLQRPAFYDKWLTHWLETSHFLKLKGEVKCIDHGEMLFTASLEGSILNNHFKLKVAKTLLLFSRTFPDLLSPSQVAPIANTMLSSVTTTNPDDILTRWKAGKPVLISAGYDVHSTAIIFYNDFFIEINRARPQCISVHRFKNDPTAELLTRIKSISESGSHDDYQHLLDTIDTELVFLPQMDYELCLETIPLSSQKVGNCTFASVEGAVIVLMTLLAFEVEMKKMSSKTVDTLIKEQSYLSNNWKAFHRFLRMRKTETSFERLKKEGITSSPDLTAFAKDIEERMNKKFDQLDPRIADLLSTPEALIEVEEGEIIEGSVGPSEAKDAVPLIPLLSLAELNREFYEHLISA